MKHIKAADLQMDTWTDQTFEAQTFEDLVQQAINFMTSDPEAAKAAQSFTDEEKEAWRKMAEGVWNNAPEV